MLGENREHGKDGKHQPDDSIYDLRNTLFVFLKFMTTLHCYIFGCKDAFDVKIIYI